MIFECHEKQCPTIFVIFGATGDLTHRKLLPALYNLSQQKLLPKDFAVVAVARRDKSHDDFRNDAKISIKKYSKKFNLSIWKKLSSKIYYFRNDFSKPSYEDLNSFLSELDKKHNTKGNKTFYLATMPNHFETIIDRLKKDKFVDRKDNKLFKIIIEKPFGNDLKSAKKLNNQLSSVFKEKEIYRIDHFLGKEAVQNIFTFRFANKIFESVWNSEHIDHVQITAAEKLGVETRGSYYDNYGALKDIVQNHLLQILALIAMEPPIPFKTESVKKEKVKVLKAIKHLTKDIIKKRVVFGQYQEYKKEKGVKPNSKTETFAVLKFFIDNKRWKNTPFYLRAGKKLKTKITEVVIQFKEPIMNSYSKNINSDVLVIRIQPHEGIFLKFNVKKPGNGFDIERVTMDFCHECLFIYNTPEAYQKLLHDVFVGDATLFTRWDEVEQAWKIIDPIAKYKEKTLPLNYISGTWGPKESDLLINKDNRVWRK